MQKKGQIITDSQMEERAKVFCAGQENALKMITSSWLDKFKQKHGIGPGKLVRRASETAIPDSAHRLETESPLVSASQTPNGISPASPAGPLSPTTSSAHPDSKEALSGFMDLEGSAGYNKHHPHSQSTTSLSSTVTEPTSSTFSGSAFSPTSQFTFSPDPNSGLFENHPQQQQQGRLPPGVPPGADAANFHRPRSQTFPNLENLEYINGPSSADGGSVGKNGESLTPKYSNSALNTLESPAHEITAPGFGLDVSSSTGAAGISSPTALHRVSSSNSLGGRSTASAGAGLSISGATPIGSSPSSPTQEDARRAADTLLSFFNSFAQPGVFDQHEYRVIVNLTEKLKLQQQQQGQQQGQQPGQQQQQQQQQPQPQPHHQLRTSTSLQGLGGLSRIPEGDVEMTPPASMTIKNEAIMSE